MIKCDVGAYVVHFCISDASFSHGFFSCVFLFGLNENSLKLLISFVCDLDNFLAFHSIES